MSHKCPECGFVKPLHPLTPMRFCPCGWSLERSLKMPMLVKVAAGDATDGEERLLAENLGDDDARELARNLHANTGEAVTLVPYKFDAKKGEYVLDEDSSTVFGAAAPEEPEVEEKPKAKARPKKKAA